MKTICRTSLMLAVTLCFAIGCNKAKQPSSDDAEKVGERIAGHNELSPPTFQLTKQEEIKLGKDTLRIWTFAGKGWKEFSAELTVIADGEAEKHGEVVMQWNDDTAGDDLQLIMLTTDGERFGAAGKSLSLAATTLDTPASTTTLDHPQLVQLPGDSSSEMGTTPPMSMDQSPGTVLYLASYRPSNTDVEYAVTAEDIDSLLEASKKGVSFIHLQVSWEPIEWNEGKTKNLAK